MKLPKFWLQHEVTVERYEGTSGSRGKKFGASVVVPCFLEEKNRMVRKADGTEVISTATFYCRLDAVDAVPESKVTLPDGRVTTVAVQGKGDGGKLPLPEHLEVALL